MKTSFQLKTLGRLCVAAMLTTAAVAAQASITNIVVNGSFENGNTGFFSDYKPGNGSRTALYPEATYQIGTNPRSYHPDFASIAAQDGINMMIVNGAPQANVNVWGEKGLNIQANTTYYFSTWVASVTSSAPANLAFSINGSSIGTLQATSSSKWQQFYTTWDSGNATIADIALVNMNTAATGNDFALDNIALDTLVPTSALPAANAVPEPSSVALAGLGMASAFLVRRRKK